MAIPSKFIEARPYSDPAAAARKLLEIAAEIVTVQGRVPTGKWNDEFRKAGGSIAEYAAGRDQAIADGSLRMHDSGTFVTLPGTNPADLA
jgi:hypothetical protein